MLCIAPCIVAIISTVGYIADTSDNTRYSNINCVGMGRVPDWCISEQLSWAEKAMDKKGDLVAKLATLILLLLLLLCRM